jgi:phytoene/squalene synthetase
MTNTLKNTNEEFVSVGREVDAIDVRISHRIIQLFSEGLYSSSNKAIEELVSNSFDAGAQNVHVILSPDLTNPDATIIVIDDGEGMDINALKEHWIIGRSTRRKGASTSGRRPIGKFGIGKLATYVLAERLTHICKSDGKVFAVTMDYTRLGSKRDGVPEFDQEGVFNDEKIIIPVRTLTEEEAAHLLEPWVTGSKVGYKALKLFGDGAETSWTVAIMSRLKPMGRKIQRGRLKWILRTAMPLRDDFKLFLNGDPVEPSKIDLPLVEKWIIGKDIQGDSLKKPCPEGFEVTEDEAFPEDSIHRYGLSHSQLGRVTGYVELYESDISGGKSTEIERSNGFFVYVRERMINTEDPGFGIPRNLLRHGTFSRFRMIVHIDSLDEMLRSSRESLQQGELHNLAKDFLHAAFNLARNRLVEHEKSQLPGVILAARLSSAPGSLTRRPLLALATLALEGKVKPLYTRLPEGLDETSKQHFLKQIQERADSEEGILQTIDLVELSTEDGLAIYDMENSELQINMSHPFAAAFQELYTKPKSSMPLEMYAMTEVLTEAHLYYMGLEENRIRDVLARRDELLRYFVRSSVQRTAGMIALALSDAKDSDNKLEEEMRAAFEAVGFANVIRIGGKGKPDGTAEAHLAASEDGTVQRYKVGLEAKSGDPVSAKRLGVSGLARHMKDYQCDHHIVIGNGFHTSTGDDTASVREINAHKKYTGKTITLMHIDDLARLVRLVPAKRIGLKRLRELFQTCITPEESKKWIDGIADEKQERQPHREILETIWQRADRRPNEAVEYAAVTTALEYRNPSIRISKQELIDCCKAMQVMAPGVVFARATTVEITCRPDLVLKDIQDSIDEYPEEERKTIVI